MKKEMNKKNKKGIKNKDNKKGLRNYGLLLKNILLFFLLFVVSLISTYISSGRYYQDFFLILSLLFGLILIGLLMFLLWFNLMNLLKKRKNKAK